MLLWPELALLLGSSRSPRPHQEPCKRWPYTLHGQLLEEATRHLLACAATTGAEPSYFQGNALLASFIDLATGDSALHRAAAARNVSFINAIPTSFGTVVMPSTARLLWALYTHQNHAGDTSLHAAARAGSLPGVTGVYRVFHGDSPMYEPHE
ncbi:hypothetical protein ABEF95_014756 [Exophiala dermatitidis]